MKIIKSNRIDDVVIFLIEKKYSYILRYKIYDYFINEYQNYDIYFISDKKEAVNFYKTFIEVVKEDLEKEKNKIITINNN